MPFGISSAGDVFQRKLDSIFGKLPNIVVIVDDIITYGEKADHSDHDIAFTNLLETARENCVKLNYEKIQYKKTSMVHGLLPCLDLLDLDRFSVLAFLACLCFL